MVRVRSKALVLIMPLTVLTKISIQKCECVCVCVLGLIDESYRTACSTGGIITAGVEQLRSRLFAMSYTHLLAHTCRNEHMHDATVHQQSKGTPSSCLLERDVVMLNHTKSCVITTLSFCIASYENTNYKTSLFFPPKSKVTANTPDLFRADFIERKNKQLSQKHFPTLSQFMRKVGAKAHSHFGLKDLGHALTG